MVINDKRIQALIERFFRTLGKSDLGDVLEYLRYPGGIIWITERQSKNSGGKHKHATAYIKKIGKYQTTHGRKEIYLEPYFKIVLIKERVLDLTDKEFLHLLAHELSHIFFMARKKPYNFEEYACDTLAHYFFGFPKPKGSTLGYLLDEVAFKKVYSKKTKVNYFDFTSSTRSY